jgi:hypothetical protein
MFYVVVEVLKVAEVHSESQWVHPTNMIQVAPCGHAVMRFPIVEMNPLVNW